MPRDGRARAANAALLTPFTPTGAIDWPRMGAHARGLLDRGLSAVGAFGTTGEGASIPAAERDPLYDAMAQAGVAASCIVDCGWGTAAADVARQFVRASEAGCGAVLLPPPFFYKIDSDDGLFRWYATVFEIAGSAARNAILYNIPSLTGTTVGIGLVGRLRLAFPDVIAGVKDSSGNWAFTADLLAEHRDLIILVGDERHLARAVRRGATGAVSGVANVAPDLVIDAVAGNDNPRLSAMVDSIVSLPIIPALKHLLAAGTGDDVWSRLRPPLVPLTTGVANGLVADVEEALAKKTGALVGDG